MSFDPEGTGRLNSFALVVYIPDPLARFLDDLRIELTPGFSPHAHVSVLPPRALTDPTAAEQQVRLLGRESAAFTVELGRVERFPVTDVIYLSVAAGGSELHSMHDALNLGALRYAEPFSYHPHVTLAQELPPEEVERVFALAERRWAEYRGPKSFRAECMTFVQNTMSSGWLDLAHVCLSAVTVP